MPITTIIFGVILTLIGVIGYGYGVSAGNASLTALIPAAFGTLLEAFGAIALSSEGLRKHMMHAAVVVALLGFVLTAGRLLMKIGELVMSPAVASQLAMAAVCLVFVILSIRSFAVARRER